jgi:hypothetical protein
MRRSPQNPEANARDLNWAQNSKPLETTSLPACWILLQNRPQLDLSLPGPYNRSFTVISFFDSMNHADRSEVTHLLVSPADTRWAALFLALHFPKARME